MTMPRVLAGQMIQGELTMLILYWIIHCVKIVFSLDISFMYIIKNTLIFHFQLLIANSCLSHMYTHASIVVNIQ